MMILFAENSLRLHCLISYVRLTGCWRDRMYNVHKEKFHLGMFILDMLYFSLIIGLVRDAIDNLGLHCTSI